MHHKISYRPEINGLRAIAILFVVFYHTEKIIFGSNFFKGGYIGVDIFFVVSGYLIGSIIFKELKLTNNFSFFNFYERRLKRIIPALIILLLTCSLISFFILLPGDLLHFSNSVLSSTFFISNMFFWKTSVVYSAIESTNIPLLHTWSLSIEEQFYLMAPLFFFLIFKFFSKKLLLILILISFLSFSLSVFLSINSPGFNFFILFSRAWELSLGTILSFIEVFLPKKKKINYSEKLLTIVSVLILLIYFFSISDKTYHPSVITFFPVLGCFFLIYYTRDKSCLVKKILSSKIFVFLGLMSYSLYLWHYPILVYFKKFGFDKNTNIISVLFILSVVFLISSLSYFFIEKPFRSQKINTNSYRNLAILTVILIAINIFFIKSEGFQNKIPKEFKESVSFKKNDLQCSLYVKIKKYCIYNTENGVKDIILLGDSVPNSFAENLSDKIKNTKFMLITFTRGGTYYSPTGKFINSRNAKIKYNKSYDDVITEFFKKDINEKIIVVSYDYKARFEEQGFIYINELSKKISPLELINKKNKEGLFEKGLKDHKYDFTRTLINLAKNNKIILIYPFPRPSKDILQFSYSQNILKNLGFKKNYTLVKKDYTSASLMDFLTENKNTFNILDNINHKNIYRIYPHEYFCDVKNDKCKFVEEGSFLFYDNLHLTYKGGKKINSAILEQIKKL